MFHEQQELLLTTANMTLVEKVRQALAQGRHGSIMSDALRRLSAFNAEMQRLGISKPQGYDLPLLDTIGRAALFRAPKAPK